MIIRRTVMSLAIVIVIFGLAVTPTAAQLLQPDPHEEPAGLLQSLRSLFWLPAAQDQPPPPAPTPKPKVSFGQRVTLLTKSVFKFLAQPLRRRPSSLGSDGANVNPSPLASSLPGQPLPGNRQWLPPFNLESNPSQNSWPEPSPQPFGGGNPPAPWRNPQ